MVFEAERYVPLSTKLRLTTEDALRCSIDGELTFTEVIDQIIHDPAKRKKLQGAMQIIARLFPKKAISIGHDLMQPNTSTNKLPFSEEDLHFDKKIDHGCINEVFFLQAQREGMESLVLKLNYQDHGSAGELAEIATRQKHEYVRIKELYKEMPDFIPWQASMIIESPQTHTPVIATVQEFQSGQLKDLFEDYSKEDLIDLLCQHEELKGTFEKFVDITLAHWQEEGEVIDLLGKKNLDLIEGVNEPALVFIDPEGIYNDNDDKYDRRELFHERLNYLEGVRNDLREKEK